MAYSQIAVQTGFNQAAISAFAAAQRRADRKKLRRLRTIKRALHFVGFLAFWAVILGIAYLLSLAAMIVFICLS